MNLNIYKLTIVGFIWQQGLPPTSGIVTNKNYVYIFNFGVELKYPKFYINKEHNKQKDLL